MQFKKMYRAVIIDDEQDSRETIYGYVDDLFDDITIVGEAGNVEKGENLIHKIKPDLVFLDINMPDGTGFDLLEKTDNKNLNVIFITAYDRYAVRAFKFSAIDYILKPIDPEMLKEAIEKFRSKKEQLSIKDRLDNLLKNGRNFEKIALPTNDGYKFIDINDILHCKSDGSYTWFFTGNNDPFLVCRQIKDYEEMLSDNGFYRVHQSHLINLKYLKEYKKGEGGTVTLNNNINIDVARRRKNGLLKAMLKCS